MHAKPDLPPRPNRDGEPDLTVRFPTARQPDNARDWVPAGPALAQFEIRSLIRLASASMANGLVSTCMPGSRWPWLSTAFSA